MRTKVFVTVLTTILFLGMGLVSVSADSGPSFTPGDGRLDPRVGDRLALYVKARTIEVWGINASSQGMYLATLDAHDLMAVGPSYSKDLGAMGKLTLKSLGDGRYVLGWVGGPFGASGEGAFAKTFSRVPLDDNEFGFNLRVSLIIKPKKIDVWGITGDNKGVWLADFTLEEMKAAWGTTLERVLPNENGTIKLTGNGNGYYMIAWSGGKFGATGQGVFHLCFNFAAYELPTDK